MRNKIFVCYRRDDVPYVAGRVYDSLGDRYGEDRVVQDVANVPAAANFSYYLEKQLTDCGVFLVVIGPGWHTDENGRSRFDDPEDWVRIEIEWALEKKIPMLAVFVAGGKLPPVEDLPESLRDVCSCPGVELRSDPDFLPSLEETCRKIDSLLAAGSDAARSA